MLLNATEKCANGSEMQKKACNSEMVRDPAKDKCTAASNFSSEKYRQSFRIERRGVLPGPTLWWASCSRSAIQRFSHHLMGLFVWYLSLQQLISALDSLCICRRETRRRRCLGLLVDLALDRSALAFAHSHHPLLFLLPASQGRHVPWWVNEESHRYHGYYVFRPTVLLNSRHLFREM